MHIMSKEDWLVQGSCRSHKWRGSIEEPIAPAMGDFGYQRHFLGTFASLNIGSSKLWHLTPFSQGLIMRDRYVLILVLLPSYGFGPAGIAQTQQPANSSGRKLIQKVEPRYPDVARRMNLSGTVKVVAVVAADGKVKKVQPVGGSPVLVQAAESAVSQWKFAPGAESNETIELHFTP